MATTSQLLLILLSVTSTPALSTSSEPTAWVAPTRVSDARLLSSTGVSDARQLSSTSVNDARQLSSTGVSDARLLSVTETFQGCVNRTQLEAAVNVTYVDLEDAMTVNGWRSVEEACYSFCLSKEPFRERLSVTEPRGNNTNSCGCHLTEELKGLDRVEDALCRDGEGAALYCGPWDKACYNSAPWSERGAGPLLLAVVLWVGSRALWK